MLRHSLPEKADLEGEVEVVDGDPHSNVAAVLEQQLELFYQGALAGALRSTDAHHQRRRRRRRQLIGSGCSGGACVPAVLLQLAAAPEEDREVVPVNTEPV